MGMIKKTVIHQFDPTIYPRKLWVMKGGSVNYILDAFTEPDGEEINLVIYIYGEGTFRHDHQGYSQRKQILRSSCMAV